MIPQGIYRHYKGGRYEVLHGAVTDATNHRDRETMVVYRDLESGRWYTRLASEFTELVEGWQPRFVLEEAERVRLVTNAWKPPESRNAL